MQPSDVTALHLHVGDEDGQVLMGDLQELRNESQPSFSKASAYCESSARSRNWATVEGGAVIVSRVTGRTRPPISLYKVVALRAV